MRKTFVIPFVLTLALALGACAPTPSSETPTRTMNVVGSGEVVMTPDIAYISIGVHTEGESASKALRANNQRTQRVIETVREFGVDEKDIRTTNLNLWPRDEYSPVTNERVGVTYVVENTVRVTVRDLDTLGELLDAVVGTGANTISSIQFDVADKRSALAQARQAAVEDAREQAEALAEAAGVTLGEVQTISFYSSVPLRASDKAFGLGGGEMAASMVPVQPGQMTMTVTVNIVYEIR